MHQLKKPQLMCWSVDMGHDRYMCRQLVAEPYIRIHNGLPLELIDYGIAARQSEVCCEEMSKSNGSAWQSLMKTQKRGTDRLVAPIVFFADKTSWLSCDANALLKTREPSRVPSMTWSTWVRRPRQITIPITIG